MVNQVASDKPSQETLKTIKIEKDKLIDDGNFKKAKQSLNNIIPPFEIPNNWIWTRLNEVAAIARGGSPRPIKSFLTDDSNGINWIKIGDSERGSIYINSTREKIKPEGLRKSRMVFPGDLILSNSMSFGYLYILNIKGCIHDGWLVIRLPKTLVHQLYIYYIFASPYAKKEFSKTAAGALFRI